jgi:hypothetical protein
MASLASSRPGAIGRSAFTKKSVPALKPRLIANAPCRQLVPVSQRSLRVRAIELDFSDPDTQLSVAGVVLGLVLGLGAPAWYVNRTERDEERLEELRAMNRATYEQTGEYMKDVSRPTWQRAVHKLCKIFHVPTYRLCKVTFVHRPRVAGY